MRQKISNIFFVLFLFLLSFLVDQKDDSEPVEVYKPELVMDISYDLSIPKEGRAKELSSMTYTKAEQLNALNQDKKYGYSISSLYNPIFANVKPSTHDKMYFVNGYLNGFVPYSVDNIWIILEYLRTRLKYQLDEKGYKNKEEVWQTSKQSYIKLRGDCEDHAILLADWLIGLGYEAKVAVGTMKVRANAPGGHAWVILYMGGEEYLLEATKKSKWNGLPLASKFPNYFPKYMFDRENFWINTGSKLTTKYSGKWWEKSGKFIPYNAYYKDLK